MKPNSFSGAEELVCLAAMLERFGHCTDDQTIACGMEAPYLIVHEDGKYLAGASLYKPKWLNLYLHPHGFHMEELHCPAAEIPAYLRKLPAAIFSLTLDHGRPQPVVYIGYANGRFLVDRICHAASPEPEILSLSSAMLKRRLSTEVSLYTIKQCPPEQISFIPLLLSSLSVLKAYRKDLLTACRKCVTKEELQALHTPLFKALMQDFQPLAAITEDLSLSEELRLLHHDYRHIFTRNSPSSVLLSDHLSSRTITKCIVWLYEDIVDRIYALGGDDEMMSSRLSLFD